MAYLKKEKILPKLYKDNSQVLGNVYLNKYEDQIELIGYEDVAGLQMKVKGDGKIFPNDMNPTLRYFYNAGQFIVINLNGDPLPQYLFRVRGNIIFYDIVVCDYNGNSNNVQFFENYVETNIARQVNIQAQNDEDKIRKTRKKKQNIKKRVFVYKKQNYWKCKADVLDDISELLNVKINFDLLKEKIKPRKEIRAEIESIKEIRNNLEKQKITTIIKNESIKDIGKFLPDVVFGDSGIDERKKEDKGGY